MALCVVRHSAQSGIRALRHSAPFTSPWCAVLCDPHRAVVIGPTPLRGEYIDTPDVRIGLGLLAAALCAHGDSIIDRAELIGRNFENVIEKLIALGAAIEVQE